MTAWVYPCPDCGTDLVDEGFSLYCERCERPVPYDMMPADPDDERDRAYDQEEASRDHR